MTAIAASIPGLICASSCPCAGCRKERLQANPLRVLKPSELLPLRPVSLTPVGLYAYKIVWSDEHDTGIYTLEHLRNLCQCEACLNVRKT